MDNQIATEAPPSVLGPVLPGERIDTLDILRGFAVLGILVVNIQSFAMVDPTYFNPTVSRDLTGINLAVWLLTHLFFDMKLITIFSMLFGAGIVLFCGRVEKNGGNPARIFRRRMFWLFVFGLSHAYLFWTGDVLVWYAFSGLIAYRFWRTQPKRLLAWGLGFLGIGTGLYLLFQVSLPFWSPEGVQGVLSWWDPTPEVIEARLQAYRGGWLTQMSERIPGSFMLQTFVYLIFGLWRTLGPMLLGMALLKWGILSAERNNRFYTRMLVGGLAAGLPVIGYGVQWNFSHEWAFNYSMYGGVLFNYWGSMLVAASYIAALMLIHKYRLLVGVQRLLAPVGRMAFTSYILQTVICTTIFYGHGLGLYGYLERWEQALVVLGVWVIVILAARLWLSRYRFGPLEWLWRSLTYHTRQPMRATA